MKSIIKIIVVLGVIGTTSSIFARPLRLDFYSESSYVRNNSWIGFGCGDGGGYCASFSSLNVDVSIDNYVDVFFDKKTTEVVVNKNLLGNSLNENKFTLNEPLLINKEIMKNSCNIEDNYVVERGVYDYEILDNNRVKLILPIKLFED
jgi:hypothetical protein